MPDTDSLVSHLHARTRHAILSLKQAPIEASLGMIMALVGCVLLSHTSSDAMDLWMRAMLMMYPLLVALFATTILHHFGRISSGARVGLSVSYLLLAGAYVYFRLDPDIYQTELWRLLTIYVSVTAGIALVPLILVRHPSRASRDFFWQFNTQLLAHVLLSVSFLGMLTIGVVIAMVASNQLLGVPVRGASYGRVAILLLVGVLPWQLTTILSRLHLEPLDLTSGIQQLGKILCTYLFLPLMSAYLLILYIYQFQVLFSGFQEAPRNMMSPLVLAAAAMLLIGMLIADQLRAPENASMEGGEKAPGIFLKVSPWLPVLFLPLMPMSAWAVGIRIDQYGLTEFRYLRMLLIVALSVIFALGTLQHFRKKPQPLMGIIATFGAIAIMASFGPLSASAVSERSQRQRLIAALDADGLWDARAHHVLPMNAGGETPRNLSETASSSIRYLAENFGIDAFEELLSPEDFAKLQASTKDHGKLRASDVIVMLRVDQHGVAEEAVEIISMHFQAVQGGFVPHAGYVNFVNLNERAQDHDIQLMHRRSEQRKVRIALDAAGEQLILTATDREGNVLATTTHDLQPLIAYLVEHARDEQLEENLPGALPIRYRDYALDPHEGLPGLTVTIKQLSLEDQGGDAHWTIASLQTIVVEKDGAVLAE